jgi:hypothetical protein
MSCCSSACAGAGQNAEQVRARLPNRVRGKLAEQRPRARRVHGVSQDGCPQAEQASGVSREAAQGTEGRGSDAICLLGLSGRDAEFGLAGCEMRDATTTQAHSALCEAERRAEALGGGVGRG